MISYRSLTLSSILSLSLCISSEILAHDAQEGKVMATVGGLLSRLVHTPEGIGNPPLWGTGLTIEADANDKGGVEVSLFYLDNQYSVQQGSSLLVERVHRIYIPLGYRRWVSDRLSWGASFFSSFRIGAYNPMYASPGIDPNFTTSARDVTEYGFDVSVQWDLWRHNNYYLVIDARYSFPVTEQPDEFSDVHMVFLGLKYEVQSKKE